MTPPTRRPMLPVCIAGMHRSGTSLMARLLNLSGLYLGRAEDMLPAGPTNPEGHWEHEGLVNVNEALLAALGGGWDAPPELAGLDDERRLSRFVETARAHLDHFQGFEPWGWKDPRNSLTLPFWRRLVGPLHVVVCVRHPLEVALSLRMRNGSTIAFGLRLWTAYTEAVLRSVPPDGRTITHYERYHGDPVAEVHRVAGAVGLPLTDAHRARVGAAVRSDLRHSRFAFADLVAVGVSSHVCRLYRDVCVEADAAEQASIDGTLWMPPAADDLHRVDDMPGQFDYDAMERLRRRA